MAPQSAPATKTSPSKPVTNKVPLRKKIQETEANIQKLQEKIDVLDAALADASLYAEEPKKAQDFARLRAKLAEQLEAAESDWLNAHDKLDSGSKAGAV